MFEFLIGMPYSMSHDKQINNLICFIFYLLLLSIFVFKLDICYFRIDLFVLVIVFVSLDEVMARLLN